MKAALRVYAVFAVLAVAIAGVAVATTVVPASSGFTQTEALARAEAQALLDAHDASSLSVALVAGDEVAWSGTFGAVDAAGTAPTGETMYGVGSVSKVVTAIAVMQLVDEGLVDLDAPVADYVTDFRMLDPEYTRITVRMLLSHSAGVPGTDYADGRTTEPYAGYPEQMLAQLAQSHLKSTPGSLAVYCNDCFTLAGLVVERVSGMPFTEYVRTHVLEPLGMTRSMYATAPLEPGEYAPVIVDGVPDPFEYLNINAAGGLLSNPEDLARLAAALLGDGTRQGVEMLSAAAVEEMGRDQIVGTLEPVVVPAFQYGLGWDTVTEPGLAAMGVRGWAKGGDTVDYHASFMLAPDHGLAIIVTAAGQQVGSPMLGTLAQSILRSAISERDGAPAPAQVPG
ncbi:MAG TPA: serine hydrolase domain-containing protein, partial [Microbacterium sp.]|nr:serine hydrolase domain-containing protein [Microbacterium sp.]